MSYDSDFENIYMVEFMSGRNIYTSFYEVSEVLEFCRDEYPTEKVKAIYKEVYVADEDDYDGQPDEAQEWHDFNSEC
jgi:hypothetical protein